MNVKQIAAWEIDGFVVTEKDYRDMMEKLLELRILAEKYGIYEIASFDEIIDNIELILNNNIDPGEDPS